MNKFTKFHTFLKYCPTCDDFTRDTQNEEVFTCNECNSQWRIAEIMDHYDEFLE